MFTREERDKMFKDLADVSQSLYLCRVDTAHLCRDGFGADSKEWDRLKNNLETIADNILDVVGDIEERL